MDTIKPCHLFPHHFLSLLSSVARQRSFLLLQEFDLRLFRDSTSSFLCMVAWGVAFSQAVICLAPRLQTGMTLTPFLMETEAGEHVLMWTCTWIHTPQLTFPVFFKIQRLVRIILKPFLLFNNGNNYFLNKFAIWAQLSHTLNFNALCWGHGVCVCVGGLMAGVLRVEVGVSGTRQVRGSYKEQNSIIFNSPLVSPLKKMSQCLYI